jgi:hypothetical protein
MVRVRAGSRVELHGMQSERGVTLSGSLVDDMDVPLGQRTLELSIAAEASDGVSQRRAVRTAADGSFEAALSLPAGRYRARARFEGDARDAATLQELSLDLGKVESRLRFVLPREQRLDLDAHEHSVEIVASSIKGGSGLALELEDERGQKLAAGRTAPDGTFRAQLQSSALGPPSMGRLIARTPGDALRAPSEAVLSVMRYCRTTLALHARREPARGRTLVTGWLRARGAGLPHKAVGLFDGAAHIATALTDEHGAFRYEGLRLPEPGGKTQTLHVQARFESDASWIGSSSSRVQSIVLGPEALPNALWLLAPFFVCALLLWLVSRRDLDARKERAQGPVDRSAGIHVAAGQARGRADRLRIAGEVLDAASGQPVRDAMVRLDPADGTASRPAPFVDTSRFRSPELEPGVWTLRVCAPGYRELTGTLAVPHRGEWSDVRVRLASLRTVAVLAYKPAALRVLGSPELWELLTARETLVRALQRGHATESFVQLTQRVERAAYARTPPSEADVSDIELAANGSIESSVAETDS